MSDILVDTPAQFVRRITLNRPEKRNAISTPLRVALLEQLRAHDGDTDVRVTIVRGAGPCFSAGYDLSSSLMEGSPFYSAPGDGQWARQANDTWFSVWDLAKPVIAQVHGYAIAGATELASACDLVYVADDALISYPVVRVASPPDWQYHTVLLGLRRAMELMLTGDAITGEEAVRIGFANRSFPEERLDEEVVAIASRVAGVPSDLQQINKRSVHRAFDVWGRVPPSGRGRSSRPWPATPKRPSDLRQTLSLRPKRHIARRSADRAGVPKRRNLESSGVRISRSCPCLHSWLRLTGVGIPDPAEPTAIHIVCPLSALSHCARCARCTHCARCARCLPGPYASAASGSLNDSPLNRCDSNTMAGAARTTRHTSKGAR